MYTEMKKRFFDSKYLCLCTRGSIEWDTPIRHEANFGGYVRHEIHHRDWVQRGRIGNKSLITWYPATCGNCTLSSFTFVNEYDKVLICIDMTSYLVVTSGMTVQLAPNHLTISP